MEKGNLEGHLVPSVTLKGPGGVGHRLLRRLQMQSERGWKDGGEMSIGRLPSKRLHVLIPSSVCGTEEGP